MSTVGLIVWMLTYSIMTIWSSNKLAEHAEIISSHPFEVVAMVGDLQTYVSEMQIRMEYLLTHNGEADVRLARNALTAIYESLDEPLEMIHELYLGNPADVDRLIKIMGWLKEEQTECLGKR